MKIKLVILIIIYSQTIYAQNLIVNSSFSEVYLKSDSSELYKILHIGHSHVKGWYIPEFVNYSLITNVNKTSIDRFVKYFTSRDKSLAIKEDRYFVSDQIFEGNLGFIFLHQSPTTIIQQKLNSQLRKGKYCFKFKCKNIFDMYFGTNKKGKIEVAFSKSDLNQYYNKYLMVPEKLIKISYNDSNWTDQNIPWKQRCFEIKLNGDEKYISIGSLNNSNSYLNHASFMIDEIELIEIQKETICKCDGVVKDLRLTFKEEFKLNEEIFDDSLFVHLHKITNLVTEESHFINRVTKLYLNNLISFMQRNPDVKLKFLIMNPNNNLNDEATDVNSFRRYLSYFDIEQKRISAENRRCGDMENKYCGKNPEYIKIGFVLYK